MKIRSSHETGLEIPLTPREKQVSTVLIESALGATVCGSVCAYFFDRQGALSFPGLIGDGAEVVETPYWEDYPESVIAFLDKTDLRNS